MKDSILLEVEIVCLKKTYEIEATVTLSWREIIMALSELVTDELKWYFDLKQPLILVESETRTYLPLKKTPQDLNLRDGCKILIY